jgi:PhnB protein
MMTQPEVKAIPDGIHTITPHLVVRDAARAADWYKAALGAQERGRIPVGSGKYMQIELWFGDSAVMLADEFPGAGILSPLALGGTPVVLHFSTNNVDALWQRALEAGATVLQPLQEQFWGDRYGQILDPFGYRWGLAQHIRDVSREEIARQASQVLGGQG